MEILSNKFYGDLENKKKKIAVIGLGYVGIPLLVSLSKYFDVIGFDINKERINSLKERNNLDDMIGKNEFKNLNCQLSSDEKSIREAHFFIITVPTPIDAHNDPDLSMVKNATKLVGRNMPNDMTPKSWTRT